MEKIGLFFCISLVLLGFSPFEAAAQTILWQKAFDSEISSVSDLSIADSPSGIITSKEAVYILDKGVLSSEQKLTKDQFATASKDGQSYAIASFRKNLPALAESISFYNPSNKLPSEIKIDGYPLVSPKADWFITISRYDNQIKFYSRDGGLLRSYQVKSLTGVTLDFSKDDRYVIMNIPQNKDSSSLALFDSSGSQIFSWEHKDNLANVSICKDGSKIAFVSERQLVLLDKQGNIIWQKEITSGGNNVVISEGGSIIALSKRADTSITVYDQKGNQIWHKSLEGFHGINSPITSLDINDKGEALVTINYSFKEENDESYLIFLDKKGSINSKQKHKAKQINAKFINQNQIILTAEKDIFVYKLD